MFTDTAGMWCVVLASLVAITGSCSYPEPLCKPPAQTTYSCSPLPAGSFGCAGGPRWSAPDGSMHQDDPDKVFPVGCRAEIPDCSPYYMGSPRGFECSSSQPPMWSELL